MRLACMLLLFPLCSGAQQKQHLSGYQSSVNHHLPSTSPQPLTISNRLPASVLSTGHSPLTVLSFFATWCPVCVSEFPRLDSLQKTFAGRVKFILVTYETPAALTALRNKNRRFASLKIPVISGDTVLSKYFPHRYLPHTVWLGSSGKVLAITGREELTAANIVSFLNGNLPVLALKKDLVDFDPKAPLLSQEGLQNSLQFQSVLTGALQGAGTALSSTKDDALQTQKLTAINYSLLSLLELALGQPFSNRWQVQLKDSLLSPSGTPFSFYTTPWCYERILPLSVSKEAARSWMLQDLSRFFGLIVSVQKQTVNCYALIKTGSDSIIKSKGGTPASTLLAKDSAVKYLRNQPIARFIKALNFSTAPSTLPIVLDETGISYNIDIAFHIPDIQNLSALNQLLPSYGLRLIPVQREIEFVVIEQKHNGK